MSVVINGLGNFFQTNKGKAMFFRLNWLQYLTKVDVSIRDGGKNFIIRLKFWWFKLPENGGKKLPFFDRLIAVDLWSF